ncbi:MAG: hypothetical protein N4A45_08105 [Flavobacteriales bacterium]|jgi:preprotein translocase subunit SecF|nr:hypothetical protein [Flavobacteriales bacterium]
MNKTVSFVFALLMSLQFSFAQDSGNFDNLPVSDKIDWIYNKSGRYKNYKVVPQQDLKKLHLQVIDSIKQYHNKIDEQAGVIEKQLKTIDDKHNKIEELKVELSDSQSKIDKMDFLGMQLSKSNYSLILWVIIGSLLVILIYFFIRFKDSIKKTREARNSLESLEIEFENYRKNALDREQKIKRQLQDEINKNNRG